jgi:hypothetical protein
MISPETVLILLAVVLGFGFVILQPPLRVRWKNWHSALEGFEPCDRSALAGDVDRFVARLEKLGFVVRGHWYVTGHSSASGQLTLLEHPQTLDLARVFVSVAGVRRHVTLQFQTRFDDGTELVTANNQITAGLPSLPETTVLWLPQVRDARALYRVHQQVLEHLGAGKDRIPLGDAPFTFLTEGRARILAHHVQTGYYFLDHSHGVYRPTWKGAVLMTSRLRWPIRPLYRAWRQRPTRQLLRRLGIPEPD